MKEIKGKGGVRSSDGYEFIGSTQRLPTVTPPVVLEEYPNITKRPKTGVWAKIKPMSTCCQTTCAGG
jgi:hypothetical protein